MSFFKRTVKDVSLDRKVVLVRADYNVPLNKDGTISDDLRIKASLPTLQYLIARGAKVVVMSHLGRPEGKEKKYSLKPVAARLSELLEQPVKFVPATIGDKVVQAVKKEAFGSVILLENLRFYPEEEANDEKFAKQIATDTKARFFVQDGFGVVHRAHASTDAITHYVPGVAGLLLQREYEIITGAMKKPKRPLVAVMGGAKVSDKITVIEKLVGVADTIIIGGAMANTFLNYKGHDMGASKIEKDQEKVLDGIYEAARKKTKESIEKFIILPSDVAVAKEVDVAEPRRNVTLGTIAKDDIALDIGDASIERMIDYVSKAGTVIWNGTLGYAEFPEFAHGSARLALALASQRDRTDSIIGGGDTADFTLKWDGGTGESFTHVSTGGGASLELMAGKKLPGVESLLDAAK